MAAQERQLAASRALRVAQSQQLLQECQDCFHQHTTGGSWEALSTLCAEVQNCGSAQDVSKLGVPAAVQPSMEAGTDIHSEGADNQAGQLGGV